MDGDVAEKPSFEVEWPPVADRLATALKKRRVPPQLVEDLIQETGLRLFQFWPRVDPQRDLWPLALTIALNVLRDHIRADNRRREIAVPDEMIEDDTEAAALARVELGRVQDALVQLTAPQRSVLLAEVGAGAQPQASSSATKMLRMRARKRLRALMEGASAAVGSLGGVIHRTLRWSSSSGLGDQLGPATSVAAGVIWATALGGVGVVAGGDVSWGAPAEGGPGRRAELRAPRAGAASADPAERASREGRREVRDWLDPLVREHDVSNPGDPVRGKTTRSPRPQKRPRVRPPAEGVRVHDPKVKVGGDGYDVRGGFSGSAVGRSARAVFYVTSRADERRSAGGCAGVNAPGVVCSRPSGGAQAEVEDLGPVDVRFDESPGAGGPASAGP